MVLIYGVVLLERQKQ